MDYWLPVVAKVTYSNQATSLDELAGDQDPSRQTLSKMRSDAVPWLGTACTTERRLKWSEGQVYQDLHIRRSDMV